VQRHHTEVQYKNHRSHHLNRVRWTIGGRLLGQGAGEEEPNVDSARNRLGEGADLFLDDV
jgi:hypothetical protein